MSEETKQEEIITPPAGVKYSYLHDEDNYDRVLTIARVFDPEKKSVMFGWAVNNPTIWRRTEKKDAVLFERKKGDQFSRKEGRKQALLRLKNEPHIAYLEGNKMVPLKAVLTYIANEGERLELPFSVVAIARDQKDNVRDYCPNGDLAVTPKPKKSFLDTFMGWFR